MNQVQSTSFASGTQFSQSIRNRITKIATTTSNGVPQEFADAFEWAADWAGKNGMTLPPDTNEFRSLRNWFCYKLNQFKKGTLGARNEALLAMHGLDFSTYEALNTGKGEREPDAPYILQLRDWRTARGTYDLDASAPVKLRQWQSKLITRYSEDGPSMRIKEMQRKLPDLHFGLWRRPSDQVPSLETRQWWQQATRFEVLTESCHAFRGELHPKTPADLVTWATAQQEKAKAGKMPVRQRGWMLGVGLLINSGQEIVHKARAQCLVEFRGGENAIARYGNKDRRLSSLLGALLAIRLVVRGASDHEICTELKVAPTVAQQIRLHVGREGAAIDVGNFKRDLTACRLICLSEPDAFSSGFWLRMRSDDGQKRPVALTAPVELLGRLAFGITRKFASTQA